jgi:hypothetical protein
MEKIHVKIGWSENNYSCISDEKALNGIIIVTNKSLDGLKKDFYESLQFHIDGCLHSGDKIPEWLTSGNYEIEYIFEVSALLHSLDGILTRSAIAIQTIQFVVNPRSGFVKIFSGYFRPCYILSYVPQLYTCACHFHCLIFHVFYCFKAAHPV